MAEVIIAGIGQTEVGEHWEVSLRDLAYEAIEKTRIDAGGLQPQALFVGNMFAAQLSHQAHLGALLADYAGMHGIEAITLEAAGASGGAALRAGYLAVASEMVDVAMVVGVEKITDAIGGIIETAMATSTDSDYEAPQGVTPTSQAALLMRRYLFESEAPREAFAAFPLTAHANGSGNPNAMFRKAISREVYNSSAMVCDPMNMFDIAPYADGAAALILTRPQLLPPGYPHPVVKISGSSLATDTIALHDRTDPLVFTAARLSSERAYLRAKISPLQVDFCELFDAYSIYVVLQLEALGFAGRGEGWRLGESEIGSGGSLPISTMGGLKARGYPGGATGIYQAVEAVQQLRGHAGKNQLLKPNRALIQSLGGPASTAATHILELV